MATAPVSSSGASTSSKNVTDEERRWMVVGICLNKVLTPALRKVLSNEMPLWYQTLVRPPVEIHKQTSGKYEKTLPPSTIKLNYDSINSNTVHKSPKLYDYKVKDPVSLSKLFMRPFMASFTGFDLTMDTSAALSVMCEAKPFFASGAYALAKKVRSDIRNEWAHCDFSHWTPPNFQAALQDMESLVKKAGLISIEEKHVLDDLDIWKKTGQELCLGRPVDPQLLRIIQIEVSQLEESFNKLSDDAENREKVLQQLAAINAAMKKEIDKLKENQAKTELKVQELYAGQNDLQRRYIANSRGIETLRNEFLVRSDQEDVYVFHAPDNFSWFTGRKDQMKEIEVILKKDEKVSQSSTRKAALCGLGGTGKTSLVVEYAHRRQDYYQGGVFWFSGENEKTLENSVNNLALSIGTFMSNSFDVTLSQTLARISRIQKPWLLVMDDMDELRLSPNVRRVLSGSWQRNSNGHIIVTTRRKPSALVSDVKEFEESCCVQLECFDVDASKDFLFSRIGISRNEDTEAAACSLYEELGGLPLALEQAAAYIKSLKCSFSSYLESYKAKRLDLLNQQATNPVSEYSSPERLAVQTTWLLNIDYIKRNSEGISAIRFLNACLFFNPNEIQEDLINLGEPPVADEQFRNFVGTSLGRYQIFKLLTDFSLFKQPSNRCLQVHRLVQDVIKESLTPNEQEESFVDAVRLLQHGFSKCFSPDELLSSVADRRTNSVDYTNTSLFYLWRIFCIHAGEIHNNLKNFLRDRGYRAELTVFLPETARIVYHYALYLSVFCRHEEAMQVMNFAVKILDWIPEGECEVLLAKPNSLFLHNFPLPEFIRRHIQYCSKAPALSSGSTKESVDFSIEVEAKEFEKLREEGNNFFRDSRFREAVGAYSRAIEREDKRELLDPRFFSNRASAYLKLGLYEKALEDAKVYISLRPNCWKGYARKALALDGLKDGMGAELAACHTYYLFREVFSRYGPLKQFSYLEQCVTFCHSYSDLLHALETKSVTLLGTKVIFLSSGTYDIPESVSFFNCIVLGCSMDQSYNSRVQLNFKGGASAAVSLKCALANLNVLFDEGFCQCLRMSVAILYNCSFTSRNSKMPPLQALGVAKVENCDFRNSVAGGLLCVAGISDVEKCTFTNNGKAGLEVREGGILIAKNVYSYGNRQGLLVGPKALKCVLTDSQINCNALEGIFVREGESCDVELSNNSIFHNGAFGISVRNSSTTIRENRVFENNWWGIWLQSNSCCHILKNNVSSNRLGGIRVGKRPNGWTPSVLESNTINDNGGPGLIQSLNDFDVNYFSFGKQIFPVESVFPLTCNAPIMPFDLEATLVSGKCRGNILQRNEEERKQTQQSDFVKKQENFCSFCRKQGKPLLKCTDCYTAEYCGRACQKKHWKRHKNVCQKLLKGSSILLTSTERVGNFPSESNCVYTNYHYFGLEEVGPKYSDPPPTDGKRFIVKVQSSYDLWFTSTSILIYDRSLEIHRKFQSEHILSFIRELGAICEKKYVEKKLFMWAAYTKNKVIRLFTNDFPEYQRW